MVLNSFNRVEEVLHIVFKSYLRISFTSLVNVLINYVSLLQTHTHTHMSLGLYHACYHTEISNLNSLGLMRRERKASVTCGS